MGVTACARAACACVCPPRACARVSLAGDSDALNVKERARQLQQLLLRSEMHAPRLTGTYGRGISHPRRSDLGACMRDRELLYE